MQQQRERVRERVVVRPARPEEYAAAGELVAATYVAEGHTDPVSPYVAELRDAARRATEAVLLVAEVDGRVAGTVTYAPPGSPWAEVAGADEGEFRMLAVAPEARRRGVGEALVRACVERARVAGLRGLALCTYATMGDAHRMYARLGFERAPERDWAPQPGMDLPVFVLRWEE